MITYNDTCLSMPMPYHFLKCSKYKQSQSIKHQLNVQGAAHIFLGQIKFIMYPSMIFVQHLAKWVKSVIKQHLNKTIVHFRSSDVVQGINDFK